MRRTLIGFPGLLAADGEPSLLECALPALRRLAESSMLFRIARAEEGLPEAEWLGLDPRGLDVAQGPLTVAALGHEPPPRSVHYHVTPLCLEDGQLSLHRYELPADHLADAFQHLERLNTSRLTVLKGQRMDHALVLEGGSLDMRTWPPKEAVAKGWRVGQPDGDDEPLLRRWIDDAVNILMDRPWNQERIEEGLQPFNVAWPWGQGMMPQLPSLLLQRGELGDVWSGSIRLQGLTRALRWRHAALEDTGRGTAVPWESLATSLQSRSLGLLVLDRFHEFRIAGAMEEADWTLRECDSRFLARLLEDASASDRLTLVATDDQGRGLALMKGPGIQPSHLPFAEDLLEERALPKMELWRLVERALEPDPGIG